MPLPLRLETFVNDLLSFPWRNTAITLRQRFREDQLGLTASSLTFTTTIALVPFFTVLLAVFTAFPLFGKFQDVLQRWLIESLVPDSIARQVLGYIGQFSSKASRLGAVGLAVLLVSAVALILTIDRTLNAIWRVRIRRRLAQRVLMYWAAMTLGPLLLAISVALTSYVVSGSRGIGQSVPVIVQFLFDALEFLLLAAGASMMFRYVPNTHVRWRHAWAGGLFVAAGIEIAKKLLSLYLGLMPTYSMVYGAFATVPILLIWIYMAWVIVLLGAVIAAYLPSLLTGVARRSSTYGWHFQLAIEVLQQLHSVRGSQAKGLTLGHLTRRLQVDALQLEPVLETLMGLDWIGLLEVTTDAEEGRYVLLASVEQTPLEPLMRKLLLRKAESVLGLWRAAAWDDLRLKDVL